MEITRFNFEERLDEVHKAIDECSFMAIDGEFTGLDAAGFGHAAPFDTPKERYFKQRNSSADFLLVQFGLCTFKVDTEKHRYEAKPYNFYVFPRPASRHAPDRRFLVQSSSIDFLCSQGFDFNKLFREGVPYLTPEQEAWQRKEMEQRHAEATKLLSPGFQSPENKKGNMPVPPEQKEFIDKICTEVETYLKDETIQEPLSLSPCNAFQRKLIYQTLETKFPSTQLETMTGEKKERYIVVHRTKNPEDKLRKEIDRQTMEKMELDIQIGFTKIIQAIKRSGKLVVGHNMMLDVMHCVNQFQCQLPEDLDDFKTVVRSVFPRLLDTKLMASTYPFKDHINFTSLEELQQTLQSSPFSPVQIDIADGFDRYQNGGGALHEAGYDAYVTGSCFAAMTKLLGTFQKPPHEFLSPTSHVLEPFVNKLFLMRINDIPYLNLNGPDLEPSRDHVFHVTFPKEWKTSDLHSLFHPYGNIQISWLSEVSAFVALYKKDNAEIAQKALVTHDVGSPYRVVTYAFHVKSSSTHWKSPNITLTKSSDCKRKVAHADIVYPPPMVKKQKVSREVSPAPAIPEADTDSLTESTDQTNSQQTTPVTHHKRKRTVSESNSDDTLEKSKLFEECSSW